MRANCFTCPLVYKHFHKFKQVNKYLLHNVSYEQLVQNCGNAFSQEKGTKYADLNKISRKFHSIILQKSYLLTLVQGQFKFPQLGHSIIHTVEYCLQLKNTYNKNNADWKAHILHRLIIEASISSHSVVDPASKGEF